MKILSFLIVLFLFALIIACGNSEFVTVEGRVTRLDNGAAIENAAVGDSLTNMITHTNDKGYFVMDSIPRKPHPIFFAHNDFHPYTVYFKPKGRADTFEVNVKLDSKPIEVTY